MSTWDTRRELWSLIMAKKHGDERKALLGWLRRHEGSKSTMNRMIKLLEPLPDLEDKPTKG